MYVLPSSRDVNPSEACLCLCPSPPQILINHLCLQGPTESLRDFRAWTGFGRCSGSLPLAYVRTKGWWVVTTQGIIVNIGRYVRAYPESDPIRVTRSRDESRLELPCSTRVILTTQTSFIASRVERKIHYDSTDDHG